METIEVEISWEDKNYCCGWGCDGFGAVLCTNKNIDDLKAGFEDALKSQVADMMADGEELPSWLASGDYRVEYSLAVSAVG